MKSLVLCLLFAQTILIAPPPGMDTEKENTESVLACGNCRK